MAAKKLENLQLYHFNTCPFCIRVRMAMKLMGVSVESKNIHSNSKYKDELVTGGGKQQVPCLRIEENENVRWLYESDDIIKYLKQQSA